MKCLVDIKPSKKLGGVVLNVLANSFAFKLRCVEDNVFIKLKKL